MDLIAVVLGAEDEEARFEQARTLLDWGFAHYVPTVLASAGETVAAVPVEDYLDREVEVVIGADLEGLVFDIAGGISREYEVPVEVEAPVSAGQVLGRMTILQGGSVLADVELLAGEDVPEPTMWERIVIFLTRLWRGWFGEPAASPAGA